MLRMAKVQDEHKRHAAQHLVAAAGTAASRLRREPAAAIVGVGRCFVAPRPGAERPLPTPRQHVSCCNLDLLRPAKFGHSPLSREGIISLWMS